MFNGGHIVIHSSDAEKDRRFFSDILGLGNVDAGDGWLIFSLPPSEIAFHPHENSTAHDFYFMCEDIQSVCRTLDAQGIAHSEPVDEGWGILSSFVLPGGGEIGFYQPRHERP